MEDHDSSRSSDSESPLLELPDIMDPLLPPTNETITDLTGDTSSDDAGSTAALVRDEAIVLKPRPYQTEMVEKSLERNIIVAMDTGSGKTHVAVLRMLRELERMPAEQIIWFLAPTVSLCAQQFDTIATQISSVQVKFLSGADGVDRWTDQSLWDAVLKNVRIVVSTYQILYDALSHAFVRMESLGLIVFDEAHNCVGKHSGAKLMQNFYHKRKAQGLSVPFILGLTASPVMRSNPKSLINIEETLDATCRTPTKHREELRLQVKLPVLEQIYYQEDLLTAVPRSIISLNEVYANLKLQEDPYVISLAKQNSERSRRELEKTFMNHKTYSRDQIKSFLGTTKTICKEVGCWAADYYVSEVVANVLKLSNMTDNDLGIWELNNAEKQYIAQELRKVEVAYNHDKSPADASMVTHKIEKLIEVLLREDSEFRGIIFVQERAVVSVLAHLLSVHPKTRDQFKIGTMVGTSALAYRAHNVGELIDLKAQKDTLSLFRSGKLNLIIATSVLEEGIDVPACNVVICFHRPANLKSFVQRRGRARQRESKLILLLHEEKNKLSEYEQLEEAMKAIYGNEMRSLQELLLREAVEEPHMMPFLVQETGAQLDMDNAVAHLYHFCATLPQTEYVDLRPEFICTKVGGGLIRAKVLLPLSVIEAVRTAESKRLWVSERNAIKDAAFQAYIALYHHNLVNNNLLPLLRQNDVVDELTATAIETRASIVPVDEILNPWVEVAKAWKDTHSIYQSAITLEDLQVELYLPIPVPQLPPYPLYWDAKTVLMVKPGIESKQANSNSYLYSKASDDTWSLLHASFGHRWPIEDKRFVVEFSANHDKPLRQLLGSHPITDKSQLTPGCGHIRDQLSAQVSYIFQELLDSKPSFDQVQYPYTDYLSTPDSLHISVKKRPTRSDFLHPVSVKIKERITTKLYSTVVPLERCTIDHLPPRFVQFGLMIPSIIRRLEIYLIAQSLSNTLLDVVNISDLNLVLTSITASSAGESTNYQRQEFLGDSILKTCTSVQLMAIYPEWHEGYLSKMKDRLVANSRLSRAAMETGLTKFIITKIFTGHKWRPLYIDELLTVPTDKKRDVSTKVLADVVEALIGASMIDGGFPKALACLQVFLPELQWQPLEQRRSSLYDRVRDTNLPPTLEPLQTLLGYKFTKPLLLLEAMTHASCNTGSGSFERLEFLGDSLLDNIVVAELWKQVPAPPLLNMHLLRTALVNADFLAFVCMDWSVSQEITDLNPSLATKTRSVEMAMYRFMRHSSPVLSSVEVATAVRFSQLRREIRAAIEGGTHYPWYLLCRLQALKFYSDIVESVIAAVWIDSGSLEVCTQVVERMGILRYLRRIVRDGVHIWHPKEELGLLADSERVKYVVEKGSGAENGDGDGDEDEQAGGERRGYACTVSVGEREIVKVTGERSKLLARTRAAEKAVEILTAEKEAGERSKERLGGEMGIEVPAVNDVKMEDVF